MVHAHYSVERVFVYESQHQKSWSTPQLMFPIMIVIPLHNRQAWYNFILYFFIMFRKTLEFISSKINSTMANNNDNAMTDLTKIEPGESVYVKDGENQLQAVFLNYVDPLEGNERVLWKSRDVDAHECYL